MTAKELEYRLNREDSSKLGQSTLWVRDIKKKKFTFPAHCLEMSLGSRFDMLTEVSSLLLMGMLNEVPGNSSTGVGGSLNMATGHLE